MTYRKHSAVITAHIVAITVAFFPATGCHRISLYLGVAEEGHISAKEFSADPLVRRLAIAVDKANTTEIAAAIAAGADVNACGRCGFRLLDWAMARNNPRGFEALLEHGASLDALYKDPRTVPDRSYNSTMLERVLATNDAAFIKAVLRLGLDPNYVPHPTNGRSLLFLAAHAKAPRVIDALLESGAEIEHRDGSGSTPLFETMIASNYNTAWHLLQKGADPTAKDRYGKDFVGGLKFYGSAGVLPDHRESFEKIVAELIRRGLLTRQDIIEADKPKPSIIGGPPGVTVIEHAVDSEAGQAILRLDQLEREANQRQGR